MEKQGECGHKTVFIDGTKMESRAGRYTFCWRGSVEKHLQATKEKVEKLSGLQSLSALREHLEETKGDISFVYGNGRRKGAEQRRWDELDELRQRWEGYEKSHEIMGTGRNSYSKTDPDAAFMRMKEDHMRNGQ